MMNNIKKQKISIVVPCYNEEGNIEVIYQRINTSIPDKELEFIFVDDNSSDKSLAIIEALAKHDKAVRFVSFSRNFGHQNALRAGLEYATGDCVISMDADLQHPPDLLPSMIKKWEEGHDVVYTVRKDVENVSLLKKQTSLLFYKLLNCFSEVAIEQGAADFRLIDRRVVNILINDITEYHLFFRGLISWVGFKQTRIEYIPQKRFSGRTKYTLKKMLNLATNGITSFSVKPLKFAVVLGLMISLLSVFYGIYVLYLHFFTDQTIQGWSSVILSVLFIGGVNMILLGIIGEYIGKLFIQSKNRPYYLIKKTNIDAEKNRDLTH